MGLKRKYLQLFSFLAVISCAPWQSNFPKTCLSLQVPNMANLKGIQFETIELITFRFVTIGERVSVATTQKPLTKFGHDLLENGRDTVK